MQVDIERKKCRKAGSAEAGTCLSGCEVLTLPFDVRDREAMKLALDSLQEEWKNIDVLINNAGLVIGLDKEHEGSLDEWDVVIDTNIKGLLAMTRMVVPGMVERQCGHIINIGSVAGDAAYAGGSVYCATKAAVKALSDGLRIDLVDTPLRVTNIKPGLVETNFLSYDSGEIKVKPMLYIKVYVRLQGMILLRWCITQLLLRHMYR